MATCSNILAWTERGMNILCSLVGYSPWDCRELDMTEHTQYYSIMLSWNQQPSGP